MSKDESEQGESEQGGSEHGGPDRGDAARARGRNVLGGELEPCSIEPLTGWHRDGCCATGPGDVGVHVVCAVMTDGFLEFSRLKGNDLMTPRPEYRFPGLKAGDRWCLCASRWAEARDAGMAPGVVLEATHMAALEFATLEELRAHAVDSAG